jgi:hypothetical protein
MEYDDYKCDRLGNGNFIVYRFSVQKKEEAATFSLNDDGTYKISISPKFKSMSIGYVVQLFIKDIKSNLENFLG